MQTLERGRPAPAEGLRERAEWIRLRTIDLVETAKSGHYSSVFSCAELFAVLYYHSLRLRPGEPSWADRDRFLLGKGHAAIGLYPCLADLGFFPEEWLTEYTRLGSPLGDHPDMRKVPGIDFSSGSIGHNLSVAAGMALAERHAGRDTRTWVMIGDGELHEGQVWEAAMSAAHFELGNLVAIVDLNGWTLDGRTEQVMGIEPVAEKLRSFGWATDEFDGHDVDAVMAAFDAVPDTAAKRPTALLARTSKGHGVSFMDESPAWHLGYLGPRDRERAVAEVKERMR